MSRTIAAISTAGYGAIGVIKISGNRSKKILEELFKNAGKQRIESDKWQNKRLYYGTIEQDNRVLDEVMAVYMKAPHTYTREDVVEIYTHGNAVCQRRILDAVIDEGAELAEPGEFTKLAFLNGRIDLTQAEAIIEMINAKSEEAFDLALQGLAGQNERSIGNARVRLQEILVEMAVNIDYPDEDIEEINYQKTIESIEEVIDELDEVIDITRKRRVYRDGIRVAILGKPNAGKSSLLNELLMEDRAIISDIEGTTRDVIEEQILLSGIPITLIDTAGIRESDNVIEKEGIDRSYKAANEADAVVYLIDSTKGPDGEDENVIKRLRADSLVVCFSKSDLPMSAKNKENKGLFDKSIDISIRNKSGMEELKSELRKIAEEKNVAKTEGKRDRMVYEATKAKKSLNEAKKALKKGLSLDFAEVDVKNAYAYLGNITGDTASEEVINKVFERFCLGK
mgnify:FL=1